MPYPFDKPRYEGTPVPEKYTAVTLDAAILGHCVGLWVGAAGAVNVTQLDGSTATILGIPAGTFVPGRFTQVNTTGTTVTSPTTNILAATLVG